MKMNQAIVIALVLLSTALFGGYWMYNQPHVNVANAKVDFNTSLTQIAADFQQDATASVQKYSDKIIMFSGIFQSQSGSTQGVANLVISSKGQVANCETDAAYVEEPPAFQDGEQLVIKGLFVGYDDLLGELQVKKCIIIH